MVLIDFSPHLKTIDRQKEQSLNSKIIKMHKRERNFPFSKKLENLNYFLNQSNFNYSNSDDIYSIIGEYYKLNISNVILTAGCDIALRTIYESLDDIKYLHLPNTCYAMNFIYKKIYHSNSSIIDFEFDQNGHFNVDELITTIDKFDGRQMVVIESPSGFTGQDIEKTDFVKLLEFCVSKKVVLVVDETYLETRNYEWTAREFINNFEDLIVVTSFSKAYGIAGLRAGMIVSNISNINVMNKLLPMHEITSFTDYLLSEVINDKSLYTFRDQIYLDEEYIVDNLNNYKGFNVMKTKTNFILFKNKNYPTQYLHDLLLNNQLKVKIHKSVPFFGDWCSASLGNKNNTNNLVKILLKINYSN